MSVEPGKKVLILSLAKMPEYCNSESFLFVSLFVQSALISKPRLNKLINNNTFSLGQSESACVVVIKVDLRMSAQK